MSSMLTIQAALFNDHGIDDPRFLLLSVYTAGPLKQDTLLNILNEATLDGIKALSTEETTDYHVLSPMMGFWLIAPVDKLVVFLLKYGHMIQVKYTQKEMDNCMLDARTRLAASSGQTGDCMYVLAKIALGQQDVLNSLPI